MRRKPKPIAISTRDFSRALNKLHGIATNLNWFNAQVITLVFVLRLSIENRPIIKTNVSFFCFIAGQIESHQSLFTYNGLESPHIFVDLNYVPMFINNINWVNDSFRLEAERVCGNNSECLFDAAVTEDTSYGINTRRLEENNNEINREFGKLRLYHRRPKLAFRARRDCQSDCA